MDQIFDRYVVSITWEVFEELREGILYVQPLPVKKVENGNSSKLLGQRTQIKNSVRCDLRPGLEVRITVAVEVYDVLVLPDHHGCARHATAIFGPVPVCPQLLHVRVYDFINSRNLGEGISI